MVGNQLQHEMLFCRQRGTFNTGAQKDLASNARSCGHEWQHFLCRRIPDLGEIHPGVLKTA